MIYRPLLLLGVAASLHDAGPPQVPANATMLAQFIVTIRAKAKALESSTGMKDGFSSFIAHFKLHPGTVTLSDYVVARLLYEATRDAGFWNLHWVITDLPPNSDNIWRQWKTGRAPSPQMPTAIAECDELSALYTFMAKRAGIRSVGFVVAIPKSYGRGLDPNEPAGPVRVVIPTTQIFLDESDYWGTKKFDPCRQKTIYEYGPAGRP